MDQIILSLGLDDTEHVSKLIDQARQQRANMKNYSTINSLQKIEASSPSEQRYLQLLERVGSTMTLDVNVVKMFAYILIFLTEFDDTELQERQGTFKFPF